MKKTALLVALLAATGTSIAAEPATVQPTPPAQAPVLFDLPNSLHERNSQLLSQRRTLSIDLADAKAVAAAELEKALPDVKVLKTEASRAAVAPTAIPAIRHVAQLEIERHLFGGERTVVQGKPGEGYTFSESSQWNAALLTALGDSDGANSLIQFARVRPEVVKLAADVLVADSAGEGKIFESLSSRLATDPADAAAIDSAILLIRREVASKPAMTDALFQTFKETAGSSTTSAKMFVSRLEASRRAKETKSGVGAELVITGTTIDGKPFTTTDWRGKVILIDFWATWCGPCKAELPRLKSLYKQYHDQGLEVLGVSNDYTAKALQDFVDKDPEMAWPQLFDESAAAERKWHPVTSGFGIMGIPTMYVIDRKGVLRSVEARKDLETMLPQLLGESAN